MTNKSSLHEDFGAEEVALPPDRSTGLVFAAVALIAAAIFRNTAAALPALAIAGGVAGVAAIRPSLLRPLNIAWMRFAGLLNRFISPVILGLVYAIAIVPAGLLMQLFRDPLLRRRPDARSFWVECEKPDPTVTSMKNQF